MACDFGATFVLYNEFEYRLLQLITACLKKNKGKRKSYKWENNVKISIFGKPVTSFFKLTFLLQ